MKKLLKIIIIGIFTVSISTGCVRFSKEDTETNVTKEKKKTKSKRYRARSARMRYDASTISIDGILRRRKS